MTKLSGLSLFSKNTDYHMYYSSKVSAGVDFSIFESKSGLQLDISPNSSDISTDSQLLLMSQKRISVSDSNVIIKIASIINNLEDNQTFDIILRLVPISSDKCFDFSVVDDYARQNALLSIFNDSENYLSGVYCKATMGSSISEYLTCLPIESGEYIALLGVRANHKNKISFNVSCIDMLFTDVFNLMPNIITVDRELIPHTDFAQNSRILDYGVSCSPDIEQDLEFYSQFVSDRELLGGDNIISHRSLDDYSENDFNTLMTRAESISPYYVLDDQISGTGTENAPVNSYGKKFLNTDERIIYLNNESIWTKESPKLFRIIKFINEPDVLYFLSDTGIEEYLRDDLSITDKMFKVKSVGIPYPYSYVHGQLGNSRSLYRYNLPDREIMPKQLFVFMASPSSMIENLIPTSIKSLSAVFEIRDLNGRVVYTEDMLAQLRSFPDYNKLTPDNVPFEAIEFFMTNADDTLSSIMNIVEKNIELSFSVVFDWSGVIFDNISYNEMFYLYFLPVIAKNIIIS